MFTRTINLTALLEYLDMTALLELLLSTIVEGQVLAMLLEVILMNFNELVSDYYDYVDDDVLRAGRM